MAKTAMYIGILVVIGIAAGGVGVYFAGKTSPLQSKANYTLTVQAPSGQGTTSTTAQYASGTVIEVTSESASGWKLDHWILDGKSVWNVSDIKLIMKSDHIIQASFAQKTLPPTNSVTFTVNKSLVLLSVSKAKVGIIVTTPPSGVVAGGSASDSAILNGSVDAGGSVTYTLYWGFPPGGTQIGNSSTKTITNGMVPNSDNFTCQAAGPYYFTASYSGDINNDAASATAECFIVGPAPIPAPLNHFVFSTISSPQTAGMAFSLTITAQDQYNNTVTSYNGTPKLSALSSIISPRITTGAFSNGVWTGSVTVTKTYPSDSITAMDSGKIGTSGAFNVVPAALVRFEIYDYPSSINAGQNFGGNNVVVIAYDLFSNVKTDYTGNIYFTSSDSEAVLPFTSGKMYTFTSGSGMDNGIHTFSGTDFTLNTAGVHTITVTDGTNTAISIDVNVMNTPIVIKSHANK